MAIDDRSRSDLLRRLDEVLGPDIAVLLMNHLPPTGWRDVATVHDLENQSVLLRSEMTQFGGELRSEIALLRSDLDARTDLLRAEITSAKLETLATLRGELANQTRTLVLGLFAMFAGLAGVLIAIRPG
jgi:hypothetical protein